MIHALVLADWLETVDSINDAVSHPDWDATVHNPWFIIGSIIFIAAALLRGWKPLLILYLGGMAVWYIAANVVNTGSGGSSVFTFAAAVVAVGGFAIYMLLIRD